MELTVFQKLPPELRQMIWLRAMWEDRYITVSGSWKEWKYMGYPRRNGVQQLMADVSWE
jgi:hypothetical protein